MIVDSHVHIFEAIDGRIGSGPTRGIGYGAAQVAGELVQVMPPLNSRTEHTASMLIAHMDWTGIDRAVLLQGPYYGVCNAYVNEAAGAYPDRLTAAAHFDPWADGGPAALARTLDGTGLGVLKTEFSVPTGLSGLHPGARLDDRSLAWLWGQLERRGLVWTVDLGQIGSASYQTEAVGRIAREHPQLRIVIAHLGQPSAAAMSDLGRWRQWQDQIDLGRLDNVWFDTAALPHYFLAEGMPYPGAARCVREAIDRIGPDKIMWGTDIPGLFRCLTYLQMLELGRQWTAFLPVADQAKVMGLNAWKVYGTGKSIVEGEESRGSRVEG